jgi:hypothetical protein
LSPGVAEVRMTIVFALRASVLTESSVVEYYCRIGENVCAVKHVYMNRVSGKDKGNSGLLKGVRKGALVNVVVWHDAEQGNTTRCYFLPI